MVCAIIKAFRAKLKLDGYSQSRELGVVVGCRGLSRAFGGGLWFTALFWSRAASTRRAKLIVTWSALRCGRAALAGAGLLGNNNHPSISFTAELH